MQLVCIIATGESGGFQKLHACIVETSVSTIDSDYDSTNYWIKHYHAFWLKIFIISFPKKMK